MTSRSSASSKPDRRSRRRSSSFSISPQNSLRWKVVELYLPAEIPCGIIEPELETCGELHRAQHAQAVVAECPGIDGSQHAGREILSTVERDRDICPSTDPTDGVDGEVAASRRVSNERCGSPSTSNARWPRPVFRLATRNATSTPATL